uniref:Protein hunchback n=1 Tax=Cacopsylla melanoneura TaxID=428564 RepID=A0A8D9FHI5_9HEMI
MIIHNEVFECKTCDTILVSKERFENHLASEMHKIILEKEQAKRNECSTVERNTVQLSNEIDLLVSQLTDSECPDPLLTTIKSEIINETDTLPQDKLDSYSGGKIVNFGMKNRPYNRRKTSVSKPAARLRAHTSNVHADSRPFKCKVCRTSFKQMGNLKIHLLSHSKERPFKCDLCEYSAKYSSGVRQHMKIHSDEKPYHCDICDYSCKHSGNLKIHMRIHFEEKQFQCKICEYACKQSSSLKTHMLTHTKKKSHQCKLCEYSCKESSSLRKHMVVHTKERPYQCE